MSFTAQLGTSDSIFSNIIYGSAGLGSSNSYNRSISDTLNLIENWLGYGPGTISETLSLNETWNLNTVLKPTISETLIFSDGCWPNKLASGNDSVTFSDTMTPIRGTTQNIPDSITLAETLARNIVANRTLAEAITFAENLQRTLIRILQIAESVNFGENQIGLNTKNAQDTLTFISNFTQSLVKTARDLIDFDSIFTLNANYHKLTADVFEPYDQVVLNLYIRRSLTDSVSFSETWAATRTTLVSESLTFSDLVTQTASKITSDSVTFTETLSQNKTKNVSLTDILGFNDADNPGIAARAALVLQKAVSDVFAFTDLAKALRARFYSASDSVSFSDLTYREQRVATAPDTLTFSETWAGPATKVRSFTDAVVFSENILLNIISYQSFADTLRFYERPPSELLPNTTPDTPVGSYGVVADQYMLFIGQTRSVVISPPQFNDYDSDRNQVVFKRKMNGAVSTYVKTCKEQRLHYEFLVPRPKADELRALLDAENGNYITIHDWEGYIWIAKLLNDTVDKSEIGRWEPSGNKTRITLEFLGLRYA